MRRRVIVWTLVVALVVLVCAAAFVRSAVTSSGHDAHAAAGTPSPSSSEAPANPAASNAPVQPAAVTRTPDGTDTLVTLPIAAPYTPSAEAGGTDDYHCFLLDPGITADTFLTGVTFKPGNPNVVHHAIVFRVPADRVAAAEKADAKQPGDGWSCFGDTGIPKTSGDPLAKLNNEPWISAWAPGARETRFGDGVGVDMGAGSRVVLQMHYNLLKGTAPDSSSVTLRLAAPGSKLTPLVTMLLPAPVELPCAAGQSGPLCNRSEAVADVARRFGKGAGRQVGGLQMLCGGDPFNPASGPTQSCDRYLDKPITIVSAAGHMHLLGRSVRIDAVSPSGEITNLVNVPVWDFDQQGAKPLTHPVTLNAGDRLRVTCTHDATLRDQLPALKDLPDRYVVWGEGTSDEMCLGIVTILGPTT